MAFNGLVQLKRFDYIFVKHEMWMVETVNLQYSSDEGKPLNGFAWRSEA